MTLERDSGDFPPKAHSRARGRETWLPAWYLRLRLSWANAGIAHLEQQLAGEFATHDTAPLQRELEALIAERDALIERLPGRA